MLAGNVPFTSDNPVTLVFKHVHEDVPSIATACKGINEGVAAFLAHLTARAVEARPADASVALTELQRLQSTLAVSDWQYRLPPVDVSASDSAAPANNGAPTNVGNPVPPAPPAPRRSNSMIAHASWTGSRRTQQPSCRCSNRTSIQKRRHVSRCRQTASSIALTMPSTALHRNPPSRKARIRQYSKQQIREKASHTAHRRRRGGAAACMWRRRLGMVVLSGPRQLLDHAPAGWYDMRRVRSMPHHQCEVERLRESAQDFRYRI